MGKDIIFRFRCIGDRALLRAMNVNLGIWDKLSRLVVCLLLVAGFLGVAVWYWPLIQTNERLRKNIFEINNRIQKEVEIAKALNASIEAIRTDRRTVERLAREILCYAKPGETIIYFQPPSANNPTKP
jgi:cell division protein FtsB